jgi:hypothetical protein
MSGKFEASKADGVHFQLSKLAGEWEGITKTWFEPDIIADQSPVHGSMRLILGGRFILHEYSGSLGEKPLEGIAIYGYHLDTKKFQSAWIDSFHNGTAIMFSEGQKGDNSFKMLGGYAYVTPELEQQWGWRTEIDIINEDEIKITAFNVSPECDEAKATETLYKKVK